MVNRTRSLLCMVVVLLLFVMVTLPAIGRQRVAVFVQAAVPIPATELQIIRNYAIQRCMIITGTRVSSIGEMMRAQRLANIFGLTSLLDGALQLLTSPLALFFGLEKEATVGLFVAVFNPAGDIVFTTKVAYADRPLLSLLTADPLEAAKRAIDSALFQITVVL